MFCAPSIPGSLQSMYRKRYKMLVRRNHRDFPTYILLVPFSVQPMKRTWNRRGLQHTEFNSLCCTHLRFQVRFSRCTEKGTRPSSSINNNMLQIGIVDFFVPRISIDYSYVGYTYICYVRVVQYY